MKSFVAVTLGCFLFVGIDAAAYDWQTPEGCSCSCPVTYKGPFPPPSSVQHLRDPWNPVAARVGYAGYNHYDPYSNPNYNAWNRDPYDPYRANVNPYYNNKYNQQWNRTWPHTGQWGASAAWNRNQWNQSPYYNPNQWNSTWNRQQPWNRWNNNAWNQSPYPGYAGVNDLRAAVAVNSNAGSDATSTSGANEVQQGASTTQNPYYYYGIRPKVSDTTASASEHYPEVDPVAQEDEVEQEPNAEFKRDTKESEHKDDESGSVESRFGGSRSRTSGVAYGSHIQGGSSSFDQGSSFNERQGPSKHQGSNFGHDYHQHHHLSSDHRDKDHGHSHGGSQSAGGFGGKFGSGGGSQSHQHHHSTSDNHDKDHGHAHGGGSQSGVGGGFGGKFSFVGGSQAGFG